MRYRLTILPIVMNNIPLIKINEMKLGFIDQ